MFCKDSDISAFLATFEQKFRFFCPIRESFCLDRLVVSEILSIFAKNVRCYDKLVRQIHDYLWAPV